MEGYISEIRLFAAAFEPKDWAFCSGQLIAIQQNMALFSLLGTTYGGNGVQTFALPDLRGRVAVGTGSGTAGNNVVLGEMAGTASSTLLSFNLPPHNHSVAGSNARFPVTGNLVASMAVSNSDGSSTNPANNYLGVEQSGLGLYANAATAGKSLNAGAVVVEGSSLGVNLSSIQITPAGGNSPINTTMPSIGMNYIICMLGIYPSRN